MFHKHPNPSSVIRVSNNNLFVRCKHFLFLATICVVFIKSEAQLVTKELKRWESFSKNISIIRDNYGVPHIYGKTDADAVFGLMYAQCEDDFARVEMNYIEKLGRKAEVLGENEIFNDLYIRLVIDSADAIRDYETAPDWLKKLLNAFSDGINYYLYTHPQTKPRLLTQFQPWYPLLWTDGSIGAISTGGITESELAKFYQMPQPLSASYSFTNEEIFAAAQPRKEEQDGSNGFAVSPAKSSSSKAMLYINPHTSFYFRPEVQITSKEGLRVYGGVTWGQFFIYQGFNDNCGWMHTSNNVDVSDLYYETIRKSENGYDYFYNNNWLPVIEKKIKIKSVNKAGMLKEQEFKTYFTHHGPIMSKREGKPISVRCNNRDIKGLIQSWLRTKASDFVSFEKTMAIGANASNNTVYADKDGNIAYWHGNFVPKRSLNFNWSKPVDGTTPETEWMGMHKLNEMIYVKNPANGWIQNCNSTPFTCCDISSPNKNNYPSYMAPDGENFRGINAIRVLKEKEKLSLEDLILAGYDTRLSAFEVMLPAVINAYNQLTENDSLKQQLALPIHYLSNWNMKAADSSIAQNIAIHWAEQLGPQLRRVYVEADEEDQVQVVTRFCRESTGQQLLIPLLQTVRFLDKQYGSWQTSWGNVNRLQRPPYSGTKSYSDSLFSFPISYASALWGMLPSFNSRTFSGTKNRYGISGNSFVCAVEFGDKIRAKSLLAGGNSGNPSSPFYSGELKCFAKGEFKEVWFYPEDVKKHSISTYKPGDNSKQ
jgi:acyl-homoserine-lactone acylase